MPEGFPAFNILKWPSRLPEKGFPLCIYILAQCFKPGVFMSNPLDLEELTDVLNFEDPKQTRNIVAEMLALGALVELAEGSWRFAVDVERIEQLDRVERKQRNYTPRKDLNVEPYSAERGQGDGEATGNSGGNRAATLEAHALYRRSNSECRVLAARAFDSGGVQDEAARDLSIQPDSEVVDLSACPVDADRVHDQSIFIGCSGTTAFSTDRGSPSVAGFGTSDLAEGASSTSFANETSIEAGHALESGFQVGLGLGVAAAFNLLPSEMDFTNCDTDFVRKEIDIQKSDLDFTKEIASPTNQMLEPDFQIALDSIKQAEGLLIDSREADYLNRWVGREAWGSPKGRWLLTDEQLKSVFEELRRQNRTAYEFVDWLSRSGHTLNNPRDVVALLIFLIRRMPPKPIPPQNARTERLAHTSEIDVRLPPDSGSEPPGER
jgi:hypothetical protein